MTASVLPPTVTVDDGGEGLTRVLVDSPAAAGAVWLHGATVTSWRPAGSAYDVVFVSPRSRYAATAAIRGGIPLCAPWFGPGRDGTRTPAHGFLRTAPWSLVGARDDGTAVTLDLRLDPEVYAALPAAAGWPAGAVFTATVAFGADLDISLAVTAGTEALDVEWALHTYVRVGDVREVRLDGLAGASYVDKVDGGRVTHQDGPLILTGETDRVYAATHPVTVTDPRLERRITLTGVDSNQTVVWNPFGDKAAGMADLGDAWPEFVCVESASVLDRFVTVAPGDTVRIGQRIGVELR